MVCGQVIVEDLLDELEKKCLNRGGQLTSLRRFILSILVKSGKPLKAYSLLEEARFLGRRLTPTSVYRVLDYLLEKGLIHKVNALNAYVVCTETDEAQLAHKPLMLVCPDCQKSMEINDQDLLGPLLAKIEALGYQVGSSIEVHGQCRLCGENEKIL
jgi:Fur family zinc uptake transcriptional regulator